MRNQLEHLRLLQTEDGSKTLMDEALNVTYRSTQGAQGESRHVFLGHASLSSNQSVWSVFELGFGAGRNCWETIQAFLQAPAVSKLHYVAVDHAPISNALLRRFLPMKTYRNPFGMLLKIFSPQTFFKAKSWN